MFRVSTILGIAMSCISWCVVQPAFAEEKPRAIIILDASGSMEAKIGGVEKMAIARKVVADILNDWNADTELGLMAYGHRQKGDCADIELLVPVGPVEKDSFLKVVNSLRPLGKTPISEATIQAADALKFTEEKATVILISDGEETCEKDPCAVATELKKKGVDFKAHVIGFDVSEAKGQAQLKCLAENTGGKFVTAKTASELKSALESVVKEVKAPEPTPAPAAATAGIKIRVTYAEGGEAVDKDVKLEVFEDKGTAGIEEERKSVDYTYAPTFSPKVGPGKYKVRATLGLAVAEQAFEVKEGEAKEVVVNLNAGLLKAIAKPSEDGEPLANGLTWRIFSKGSDKVLETIYDDCKICLGKGNYTISVKYGEAEGSQEFEITPGKNTDLVLTLSAGILKPKAVFKEGGSDASSNLSWHVVSAKENLSGDRKDFGTLYDAEPQFRLSAGQYVLITKCGEAEVKTDIEIKANEATKPVIVLNAGLLSVKTASEGYTWKVLQKKEALDGTRKQVWLSYDKVNKTILPAGEYVVILEKDSQQKDKTVEIKADEKTEVELNWE